MTKNDRIDKALAAIAADRVEIISDELETTVAQVVGSTKLWEVTRDPDGWRCRDINGGDPHRGCYHIEAVQLTLAEPTIRADEQETR